MSAETTPAPAPETIGDVKPTPEPAPAPEPKPEEKPSGDEISDGIRAMLKDRLKGKPAPKEEKKPKEEKPKEEPKPKAEEAKPKEEKPKEEPKPEEPKPKVKVAKKAPAPDVEAIATKAATAATKAAMEAAVMRRPNDKPKPALEDEIAALPEEYREDVPVLRKMEERWPDKYKGLTEKYVRSSAKIEAYRNKWEQDNPGHTFDPEAHEHSAFIEANEVDWNDRDYSRILSSLESESAVEKERAKFNEKLSEVEGKLVERELEPVIRSTQAEAARTLIEAIDKDFVGMVEPDGRINKKEIDRLKEVDDFKVGTLMGAASETARFIDSATRIFHESGRFKFDEKNDAHMAVLQFLVEREDSILAAGDELMVNERGQVFVTREDWSKLKPAERRRHWRLEVADLVYMKQREQQVLAQERIKEWDKRVEKMLAARGYTKGNPPNPAGGTTAKPEATKPAPAKPSAPSATDGIKVDTSGKDATKPAMTFEEKLKMGLRGSRMK